MHSSARVEVRCLPRPLGGPKSHTWTGDFSASASPRWRKPWVVEGRGGASVGPREHPGTLRPEEASAFRMPLYRQPARARGLKRRHVPAQPRPLRRRGPCVAAGAQLCGRRRPKRSPPPMICSPPLSWRTAPQTTPSSHFARTRATCGVRWMRSRPGRSEPRWLEERVPGPSRDGMAVADPVEGGGAG